MLDDHGRPTRELTDLLESTEQDELPLQPFATALDGLLNYSLLLTRPILDSFQCLS